MTTYDLRKKTNASTGQRIISLGNDVRVKNLEQRIIPLGPADNTMRVIKLEKRISDQEQKLDKILNLLQHGNNLPTTDKQSS